VGIIGLNNLKPGGEEDWIILRSLLLELNVPEARMGDIHWLDRNLLINNTGPEADQAMMVVRKILKDEIKKK